jgi:hypothetical protein
MEDDEREYSKEIEEEMVGLEESEWSETRSGELSLDGER